MIEMLSDLKVHDVYRNAFVMMTEKMAGFTICDGDKEDVEYHIDIMLQSKGDFQSAIVCHMESTLYEAVLMGMNAGKTVSAELKQLFIGDYMNVVGGHALTNINNLIGTASRLTVPKVSRCLENTINDENGARDVLYFTSAYGRMRIDMNYEERSAENDKLFNTT